jgi:Dr1-associated corepressor
MLLYGTVYRKHAVETTEMLDFLKEIVQGVPDPSAGGTVELESGEAEPPKKRRKTRKSGQPESPVDGPVEAAGEAGFES